MNILRIKRIVLIQYYNLVTTLRLQCMHHKGMHAYFECGDSL